MNINPELLSSQKWFVTGASGLLGHHLSTHLLDRGADVVALHREHDVPPRSDGRILDITDLDALRVMALDCAPDVIVHCAGLTNVDACETQEDMAHMLHADAAAVLAGVSQSLGSKMVYISTDHLWNGKQAMVGENMPPSPLNAYARTKLAGEEGTLAACPESLLIRTNFFGPGRPWRKSFSDWIVGELSEGRRIMAFSDAFFTPICLSHLCLTLVDLVGRGATGVFNVTGADRVSKYDFAIRLARAMALDEGLIINGNLADAGLTAPRPSDMSLSTEKISAFLGQAMPGLDECFDQLKAQSQKLNQLTSTLQ